MHTTMTKTEQIEFVSELSANIAADINRKILDGKVPSDWDGHELRMLMKLHYARAASMSLIARDGRSRRAKDYRNVVLVNNL